MKKLRSFLNLLLIAAVVLVAASALSLPSKAVNAKSVTVNGVTLQSGQVLLNNSTTVVETVPSSGGYAYFYEGRLTLENFTINTSKNRGISAEGDLRILLYGNNSITTGSYYCVYASGYVEYGGSTGTLTLKSSDAVCSYSGGSTRIYSGTVTATSETSNAINAQTYISVTGGTINATSKADSKPAIWVKNDMTVSGGKVNATAVSNAVNVSTGNLTITGGELVATSSEKHGAYVGGTASLGAGRSTITGGRHGLYVGAVNITSGYHKIVSKNTDSDNSYCAIYPEGSDKSKISFGDNGFAVGNAVSYELLLQKVTTEKIFDYDYIECGNFAKIGGVIVPSGYYLKQGSNAPVKSLSDYSNYVEYTGSTLNMYDYSCSGNTLGIFVGKDLKINLNGENSISSSGRYPVRVFGDLLLVGKSDEKTLNVTSSAMHVYVTGELKLQDAKLLIQNNGTSDVGLSAGSVVVPSGTLNVVASGEALNISGNATVSGGELSAISTNHTGAVITGQLKITGGEVNFAGDSYGITADSIDMTGGYLTLRSYTTSEDNTYYALNVAGEKLSINSKLAATASEESRHVYMTTLDTDILPTYDYVFIGDYVTVRSVVLRSGMYLANNSTTPTATMSGSGYAYYSNGTLVLNNYIATNNSSNAVNAYRDLMISLQGTNELSSSIRGIYADGKVTISGTGSLKITSTGINAIRTKGDLSIAANVTAICQGGISLLSEEDFYVTSGTVRAESGGISAIVANGMVSTVGGKLIAISQHPIEAVVHATSAFVLNGGTAEITGKGCGIEVSEGNFVSNRGTITLTASQGKAVALNGNMNINGGSVTLTGATAGVSVNKLTVSDGTLLISSNGDGQALSLTDNTDSYYWVSDTMTVTASQYSNGVSARWLDLTMLDDYKHIYVRKTNVQIGGVNLPNGCYLANGSTTTTTTRPSTGYAYYQSGVLTLHDFSYDGTGETGVYCTGNLDIQLEGSNFINTGDDYGIYVDGICLVYGTGELDLDTANAVGFYATSLLRLEEGNLVLWSDGQQAIQVSLGDLSITGGTVTAMSNTKSAVMVRGTTTVCGGNCAFLGKLSGLSTGKIAMVNGSAVFASVNETDSWEALSINSSDEDAYMHHGSIIGKGSAYTDGKNAEVFDRSKLTTYNYVCFEARKLSVSGTVTGVDSDTKTMVYLYEQGMTEPAYEAEVKADGTYSFDDVLPSDYTLRAVAEGYVDFTAAISVLEESVRQDIVMTPKKLGFTVYFYVDGNLVGELLVDEGCTAEAMEAPAREGMVFLGWYLGDTLYDFSTPVADDIRLEARFAEQAYTVSGYVSGTATGVDIWVCLCESGTDISSYETKVNSDGSYSIPDVAPGSYTLKATAEGHDNYTADITVTVSDVYHEIEMTPNKPVYSVLFYFGETPIFGQEILEGDTAVKPADPAQEGQIFLGWYLGDTLYDFSTPVTENIDLYARFENEITGGITVNCIGAINYSVSGQTVTVDHEVACKVVYLSGSSYVAITPVANGDGTYSFTAPDGVTEVVLMVKGDVTGDGKVNIMDVAKLYAHVKGTELTDPYALSCGDTTDDGKINIMDVAKLYAYVKGTASLLW